MGFLELGSYVPLKDLRVEISEVEGRGANGGFTLCFWLYLNNATPLPSAILLQCTLKSSLPTVSVASNAISCKQVPSASNKKQFPVKKWVHISCEISQVLLRLHIDGEIIGEMHSTSPVNSDLHSDISRKVSLCCIKGNNGGLQGYIYGLGIFSEVPSIQSHCFKDSPIQLSIDSSSAYEIDEDVDGVWNIVGGKASCRKKFSLDVMLLDALGRPVNEEGEVVASLVYADSEEPVEKPSDAEAPLLSSYDGVESTSSDRPSKLIQGRASFKLKISQ